MTTWSIHSGRVAVRSRAARAARAPSSSADTSLNAPTYSVMGVRAPPTITTSLATRISRRSGSTGLSTKNCKPNTP